jgi:recombination protein U
MYGNRGMTLEEDINTTNQYYLEANKAVIHKKPTPVQIVKVNYPKRSAAVITEAYFKQASTTDYNGVYRQKHIDFEAKETKNKTLFPLANIHEHQLEHMKSIVQHGGISFLIIRFRVYNETFYLPFEKLLMFWNDKLNGGKKSISYQQMKEEGFLIPFQYQARVDYLSIIDELYFAE